MGLGIFSIIGIILFLYLTWRNLRDNYQEEHLISYSWMALLIFWISGRLVYGLENWGVLNGSWFNWINLLSYPGISYIGGYFGFLAITYILCKNNSWKFWQFLEDVVGNMGIFLISMLINELVFIKFNLQTVLVILVLIICLVVSGGIKKKYRSFVWYKSGKKGFAFFFVNFLFWILFSGIVYFLGNSKIQFYLCLVTSLISLVGLFILGEVIKSLLIFDKGKK